MRDRGDRLRVVTKRCEPKARNKGVIMCHFIYIKSATRDCSGAWRGLPASSVRTRETVGVWREAEPAGRGQRYGVSGLGRCPSRRPRSGSSVERIRTIYALLCMCAIILQ